MRFGTLHPYDSLVKCGHDHVRPMPQHSHTYTVGGHRIAQHDGVILLHTLLQQTVERIRFCDPVPFLFRPETL